MRFRRYHGNIKLYRRIALPVVFVVVFYLPFVSFSFAESDPSAPGMINNLIQQVRKEIPPLDFSKKPTPSPAAVSIFQYYDIYYPHQHHYFGTIWSGDYAIAAHIFTPLKPDGTVFLLHGYFDHTGILKHLIQHCLNRGLAVACFDLPGHGLSSGDRGAIEDFSQYVSILERFYKICSIRLPAPYYLLGHSLGGVVALRMLATYEDAPPGRLVCLGSPLTGSRAAAFLDRQDWADGLLGSTLLEGVLQAPANEWGSHV